jgi:hypothetical protein
MRAARAPKGRGHRPRLHFAIATAGDFSAIIPILRPLDEAGPHRIFHDVLLFDVVAFLRSQHVIKKFPLPQRRRQFRHAKDLLCGPLLESANETRKRRWVDASAGGTEEVQMVRHYDKGPYCPTMTRWSGFDFPANDAYDIRPREDRPPIGGALVMKYIAGSAQTESSRRRCLCGGMIYTLFTPGAENPWVKLYENCL